jgi:putative peptidoglycan lipid II flippase
MLNKLFKKTFLNSHVPSSVMSAAFLITIAGLISRILGLFRDRLLASTFGAGDTLDIYYAAFRIPDLIYNMLILGALSAAFIPIFTSLISNQKEKEAWKLAGAVMNLAIGLLITFGFIFCIFSPWLMRIITPGFSPEKMEKVIMFSRIMFLSPLFLGISGIFGGVLTSYKRFFIYSLAPIFYNAGIIFGIIFFVRFWGPIGLAWGVILGAFLHMLTQYPSSRQLGFRFSLSVWKHLKNSEVRKVFRLMIPRTMGIAVNQVNLFVITIFASFLASGSLAIFSFAQNLQSVPLGIIGVSFAIAVFPTLSALYSKGDKENFILNFSESFRQILFFIIPLSAFILLLRAQIVRVVLGAGKFDWEDTVLTFQCLGIFSLSLFAQSLVPLLARTFYAMHNTKTPFYIALVTEAINILAVVMLIGKYQILSLAMAFSLSAIVQMMLLLFLLRLEYDNMDDKKIVSSVGKIVFATLCSGAVIQATKYITVNFVDMNTFLGVFSQLTIAAFFGAVVFLTISHLIGLEEYFAFKKSITRRIFKKENVILAEDTSEVSGI